jgi:hypothetical protein
MHTCIHIHKYTHAPVVYIIMKYIDRHTDTNDTQSRVNADSHDLQMQTTTTNKIRSNTNNRSNNLFVQTATHAFSIY